jgi:hypothetical protein
MLALIKLQNGQELIGNMKEEQEATVTLEDPLQINYRLIATQPMPTVSVSRYMPFASEKVFAFDKKDLLHVSKPKSAMAEYYKHALNNYKKVIDRNVDEELRYAATSPDDEEDDSDEITEAYKALLERMNFKGPLN